MNVENLQDQATLANFLQQNYEFMFTYLLMICPFDLKEIVLV